MYQVIFFILFLGVATAETITLQQAEQIALCHNKDLCRLRQLYEAANQGRFLSVSKWLPEVNFISNGYKAEQRQMVTNTRSAFISQFELTQAVFSTEKYYNVKIAYLQDELLKRLLQAMIIDVLYNVRTAYYQVILDQQNIQTSRTNVEILGNLAQQMESNYRRGTSILLNVNQSKVAIANATTTYYQAIKQAEIDLDQLVTILGFNAGEHPITLAETQIPIYQIPEIATKVERVQQIFKDKEAQGLIYTQDFPRSEAKIIDTIFSAREICEWETLALDLRPELRSKCTEWKIANEVVNKDKGAFLPELEFQFNYGGYPTFTQFDPSSNLTNQQLRYAFGFEFRWLLFNGYGRYYQVAQARHERNAKCCEYKKEVQITFEEVRKEIFSIAESVASFTTAEGNVALAEQTLDLANKQLDIGYITIFDYQIVVNTMIQALYIRDQARYDLIKGYYGLRHASGFDLTIIGT